MNYLFPFDEVAKSSNIVIYGGGEIGQQFLNQIMCLNYCNCLFIIDRDHKKIQQIANIEVCAPEQLKKCDSDIYDKIVIASEKYMNEIHKSLLELNIPNEKIVKKIGVVNINTDAELNDGLVHISDYSRYNPKHRHTLEKSKIGEILNEWYTNNKDDVRALVQNFCLFKQHYEKIPLELSSNVTPNWFNGWITPFDAISIYGFLALKNPRYYVEVGSGNTTLFAAQSIRDNNLRTKIVSIDPFPRADIDSLCYKLYRMPFEDMDVDFFSTLSAEDILLLDNSHRSFPNSDVTVFFTEVLPRLQTGTLYAMHDIFLPMDYPEEWSNYERRWYNEQYLLCSYILGGSGGDKIKCPNWFLSQKKDIFVTCASLWGRGELLEGRGFSGAFFWLEKA